MREIEEKCRDKGLAWVGSEGPSNAKIAIVGDCIRTIEEERLRKAFLGGGLLDNLLTQTDLKRGEVYLTNVIKVRPPKGEAKLVGALGLNKQEFIPLLKEELEKVKPNVVVALGNEALSALTSLYGIMSWRGSILESTLIRGLKVIPSIHPADVLKTYKWKPLLQIDLKKVKEESLSPIIDLPKRRFLVEPSFSELKHTFDLLDGYEKIASDIEVDLSGLISCLGLSGDVGWAISIPFRKGYGSYWGEGEEYVVWRMIRDFFKSGKKIIQQNALFDMKFLVSKIGYFDCYMDTMWAHQLCYAEIAKGLDTLCSIYTREPYYKEERKLWKDTSITRQLWLYNAKDAVVTLEVALRLEQELISMKLGDFFFGFVMKLLPILLKIEMRGMRINEGERIGIRTKLMNLVTELEKDLGGLNVNSHKQLAHFLYDELGLPKQIHHKKGTVTTNKEALIKLRSKMR